MPARLVRDLVAVVRAPWCVAVFVFVSTWWPVFVIRWPWPQTPEPLAMVRDPVHLVRPGRSTWWPVRPAWCLVPGPVAMVPGAWPTVHRPGAPAPA